MKQRDPFFDNAKFILIVLVILGHVLPIDLNKKVNMAVYEWVYSFHMPLFIFISGYFTKISNNKKFWQSILKFLETFVIFTIIHIISSYLQGGTINIVKILTVPKFALWYLLSLIWWRLMLYYTPSSIRENHRMLLILSIVICYLLGWVPINNEFSFQRTFAFLPFFIAGYIAGSKKNDFKTKGYKLQLAFLIFIALIYFISPKSVCTLLRQEWSYLHNHSYPIFYFAFRVVWLFFAGCMSYCFLSIIPRKEYSWTHFGQLTLFIYIYHSVFLSWRYFLRDTYHIPTSFLYCILYSVFVLVVILLMSKIRFFHWLLNPISSTINKIKTK